MRLPSALVNIALHLEDVLNILWSISLMFYH